MLGKLLKYEFMAEWKKYMIIFGGMLFLALSMLILNKGFMDSDNYIVETAFGLVLGAFVMLCMFALFIVFVFSTIRFYKNIFRDEGYLMNTLPCTAGEHLASKIISTYVWSAATVVVIFLSIGIASGDFTWPAKIMEGFWEVFEMEEMTSAEMKEFAFVKEFFGGLTMYMVITLVLSPLLYQIYLNFCIAIGSLFNTHKILMAVVTFVGVNIVSQVISTVAMFIMGYAEIDALMEQTAETNFDEYMGYMINYMNGIYIFTGVFCVIMYGAMLWATHFIMSKKLNLA